MSRAVSWLVVVAVNGGVARAQEDGGSAPLERLPPDAGVVAAVETNPSTDFGPEKSAFGSR